MVQETGIKTISMEKKRKKAKWLSGEVLQIAVKRREVKSKGAKENTYKASFKKESQDFPGGPVQSPPASALKSISHFHCIIIRDLI